ncbi:PIN domain-containing protein [Candidatus Pacearchaeota archaeon]|nr:PIN domain-containing protein [Candidatus Pacearchaeota archaeon]
MTKKIFFDTYALVEIYKGNLNYEKYKTGFQVFLNKLNILEYVYFLMREERKENFTKVFENLNRFNVNYDDEILVNAAKMKFKYKKNKVSFTDCVGYLLAKKHGAKFLTGDKEFEKLDNVEFVK